MKKNCLLFTVFLLFLCSCSTRTIPALSPEQTAAIEEEVIDQYGEFNSAVTAKNYERWSACYSKDYFISAFEYPMVDNADYDKWMLDGKEFFSHLINHESETYDISVTPLCADLALSTQYGRRQNWFKDSPRTIEAFHATFLWKKEAEGWKIIHVNDTGFPRDN